MNTARFLIPIALLLAGCQGMGLRQTGELHDHPHWGEAEADDGVAIQFTSYGEGSPALVLIHGWCCDQTFWNGQIDALQGQHRVITLDLPGHGASGRDRQEWTLAGFGSDVRAVADELELERMILIGHSMGGPVALEAAARMPGRVLGVIGVDTLHDADQHWDPAMIDSMLAAMEAGFPAACDNMARMMAGPQIDPQLADRVAGKMSAAPPGIAIALMRHMAGYDEAAALKAAGVPVRCVNSAGYPTDVEGNRQLADFDAVSMEGVGHFLMLEKPTEFNERLVAVVRKLSGG